MIKYIFFFFHSHIIFITLHFYPQYYIIIILIIIERVLSGKCLFNALWWAWRLCGVCQSIKRYWAFWLNGCNDTQWTLVQSWTIEFSIVWVGNISWCDDYVLLLIFISKWWWFVTKVRLTFFKIRFCFFWAIFGIWFSKIFLRKIFVDSIYDNNNDFIYFSCFP